jgi:hypothetical protein
VAAEPEAVDRIAAACARLPLALTIAAARAATRPGFPLGALAGTLADTRNRLDALAAGDAATDVRVVFSWSYQALGPAAARLFRLLGLHPGPDITARAAASLAAVPVAEADRLLAELAKARGFPDGGQYEEQFNALSVHHAHHVHGYRRVHAVAGAGTNARQDGDGRTDTEDLRAAMVEARALFEDLVGPPRSREESRTSTDESHVRAGQPRDGRSDGRGHLPWAFNRRHAKGS